MHSELVSFFQFYFSCSASGYSHIVRALFSFWCVFVDPLHPGSYLFLIPLLVFICLVTFGSYFSYDLPGSLSSYFIVAFQGGKQGTFMNEVFYSVYSWPNTILPFFGGFLIDRVFGLRLGTLIF